MEITSAHTNSDSPDLNCRGVVEKALLPHSTDKVVGEENADSATCIVAENRVNNANGVNDANVSDNSESNSMEQPSRRERERSIQKGFSEKMLISALQCPEGREIEDTLTTVTLDKTD
ncbi:hypothetical protein LSM04_001073 [Trypanosoma melophagium]|uniref:uncharacterized protein n=1 Tax=Trypanosoma melophagium TaxID=715481 RepID=UPI003519D7F5|nr:hypothetical protein LSM04_001073 [Trypanosoma melophagium]